MRGWVVWSRACTISKGVGTQDMQGHSQDMRRWGAGRGGCAPEPLLPKAAKQRPGCTRSTQCPDLVRSYSFSTGDHEVEQCKSCDKSTTEVWPLGRAWSNVGTLITPVLVFLTPRACLGRAGRAARQKLFVGHLSCRTLYR